MREMENSAGAADREMEIITDSITYKLNALRETGTGIWQNLFQRDEMGMVIDGLTGFLTIIEKITDHAGLFGTAMIGGGIGKGIKAVFDNYKALKDADNTKTIFDALKKSGTELIPILTKLAPLLAIVSAGVIGYKVFDYMNSGWTRAQEAMTTAVKEYEDADSKLKGLESQRDTNLERAKTIAASYDVDVDGLETVDEVIDKIHQSGKGITLVDEAELSKLSNANKELETSIKLQESLVNIRNSAAVLATRKAIDTEKSYWEEVRGRHGEGVFGSIASVWDYMWSHDSKSEDYQNFINAQDTTTLGLATQALKDYKEQRDELLNWTNVPADDGDLIAAHGKTYEELSSQVEETGTKLSGYIEALSSQAEMLSNSKNPSDIAKLKEIQSVLLEFQNMDLSEPEAALNNINHFFDGSTRSNAIKDALEEAAKEGKDLEEVLAQMGLSLEDLNLDKSADGLKYLSQYFADATKSAKEAKQAIKSFAVDADAVAAATKTENSDADWTTIQSAYKSAKELLTSGKTGVDDFQAMAQFFSPKNLQKLAEDAKNAGGYAADVYQKAFEDAQAKADRWFGEDETKSLMNFADDMQSKGMFTIDKSDEKGLWDIETNFKNTAEAADAMGVSVQAVETLLSGLEAYGYDFSGIEKSGDLLDSYTSYLSMLTDAYNQMEDGAEKFRLGKLIEGFEEEYSKFSEDLSGLSQDQIVRIKFEYDLATLQNDIDEFKARVEAGGSSEDHASLIVSQDKYISQASEGLGLNKEGVKIPAEFEIAQNTEAKLKEQLQQAVQSGNETEAIKLQGEIENQQDIQKQIIDSFKAAHPEITPETDVSKINKALETQFAEHLIVGVDIDSTNIDEYLSENKNSTVKFDADVDGVESQITALRNEDGTVTYTANIDGVQTEVQEVQNEDGTITYTTKIEGEEKIEEVASDKKATITANVQVNGAEKVSSATAGANDKNVSVNANVTGTDKVNTLASAINAAPSSKSIPVTANVSGKGDVDSLASSIRSVPSSKTSYVNVVHTTINKTVNAVDGTAHARGTAFSKGTARKGVSFAGGNWGTKSSGVALVGEENPEILVRNGRWQLIGENSAEFVAYKKGDIELCPHTAMCA